MKDRAYVCKYYESFHKCKKNKEAEILGKCQSCQLYEKKKGTKPFLINNKRAKLDKIRKKEDF